MAPRLGIAATTAALLLAGLLVVPAHATVPPSRYPVQGNGTNVLDKASLLGASEDPAWFQANIPFLEVPDRQIQDVYYYRWMAYKEHLVYTGPEYGWLSNEFLSPASYGAPYGGISAAAGHQITEGRWLRDQQYVKDAIGYWLNGPGQFPKPRTESLNPDTGDWAHQYSFWAADAVWQQYLAAGDGAFTTSHKENLVRQYDGWADHFNPSLGLYWQVPVWDASEYTASSHETSDPYHGGDGYRPTLNSYQYGDARAIANIAGLTGDTATANTFNGRADALRTNVQNRLWDAQRQFYYGLHRDSLARTGSREIMGYLPWMFNLPSGNANAVAWSQLKDPQGFKAPYGPTTAERRSPWFMYEAGGCCRWNGPSWPFATAQTLTAAANLLNNYPAQSMFTSTDYVDLLRTYAATQYRNGVPYVAEAHHPDENRWLYDGYNHSEDYNHSTYVDNVISGLIGLRGQPDDTVQIRPLAPATWDYFALENTPYHGHNVSVFWDRTGSRYGLGAGLRVFVDGALRGSQAGLSALTVDVGAAATQSSGGGVVNIAANGQRLGYRTGAFASYTSPHDDVYRAVDGQVWRTPIPNNTRWTSWNSPNAADHLGLDFQRPVTTRNVRLYFYDDGGGVRVPLSFDLQYWTGGAWAAVPAQHRTALSPTATEITFPPLDTTRLRVVAPNRGGGVGWGVQEFEVWSAPIFTLFTANNKVLAVQNAAQADNANVQQYDDTGTLDHRWTLVDAGGGFFKIVNLNSGLLLSTAGSQVQQYHDTGSRDQQWSIVDTGGGQMKLRNRNSGLFLGIQGGSTANGANVVQVADGALWTLRHSAQPGWLSSDFEDQTLGGWQPVSGSWSVCRPASWELCGTGDAVALAGNAGWRAYTVDASVRASAGTGEGGIALLARAQDATHFYQAELKRHADGSRRWVISKNDGGQWTNLANGPLAWPPGEYLNLRFAVQGDRLTMALMTPAGTWQTLGSATDTRYVGGRPGVRTWGLTGSFDIVGVRAG
jgi:hypothetical protein